MGRTILITGATGFLGGHLRRALEADGDSIAVVSRDRARAMRAIPTATAVVSPGEGGTYSLAGAHAVINLAGEPVAGRWTKEKRENIESSRIEGTRALVRSIAATDASTRPKVLVSASAIGFYGDRGEEILDESSTAGADFLAHVCSEWEREAHEASALGVRVACVRIGLVMGKDGGALEAMRPLFAAGLGGPLASGRQWWPWIHVDDLVGIFRLALDRDELSGAINATAPSPVRQREHAKALGKALHRPAFLPAPALALRTVLGEFSVELLASRRVVPKRATELGYRFVYPELEPALASIFR